MDYKVALIILLDKEGKYLLQHRSIEAKLLPGYWAFFGGGFENNESSYDAVTREAFEELNYALKSPQLVLEENFKEGEVEGRLYIYLEFFNSDKSALRLQEGQDWGWFNISETAKLKMIGRDRMILRKIDSFVKAGDNFKT